MDRSNACAAQKPEPRPGMPGARILPLKGVGKRNAAAALGLVLQPPCPCTRQLLAQAGCQALRVTSRPDRSPCPPHDDRAVIPKIQILDPQLQTLTDPHARSIQKLGEQTMLAFQKTEDANHFIRGSAPPASAATAEVFRSPEARADPCTAPCRRKNSKAANA